MEPTRTGVAELEGMFHSGSTARASTLGVAVHRIGADRHLADAFLGAARVLPGAPHKAALLAALPARDRARFLTFVRALLPRTPLQAGCLLAVPCSACCKRLHSWPWVPARQRA